MAKGDDLNKRVWSLFERAGFHTQPNSGSNTERTIALPDGVEKPVDLFATDAALGISIVGSNKSGRKISDFYDHIAGLEDLRDAAKANGLILVAPAKEFSETELRFLRKKGVQVWGDRELTYFEALVDAIGPLARYEILNTFGISTEDQTVKATIPALMVKQPSWSSKSKVELYMFCLPADVLLKTCSVLRKARGNAFTYQRILSRKRLPRIGEFVDTAKALLPTSIVVHLSDSVVVQHATKVIHDSDGHKISLWQKDPHLVTLTIPLEYASMEIIDGQHRLFGFVYSRQKTRDNFNLIVIGIRNLGSNERSKTFVAINDKAKRVDPSLVSFLRYTDNERSCQKNSDLMAIKIAVELNKKVPFKGAIRLWDYGQQKITLKGLSGYDLKGMVGQNGVLHRYYPQKSEAYVGILRMYFSAISGLFENEWKDPKTYIIATNRGVTAFLKLLKSIHKNEQKRADEGIVKGYLSIVKDNWIKGTWETSKLDTSYSASQGWKQFHRDLIKTIQKKKAGFRE
jgi:DGQHR domain-containing protein